MKDDLATNNAEIDFANLEGMIVTPAFKAYQEAEQQFNGTTQMCLMKNLVVIFDAQSVNLELKSSKIIPNDKAAAVLEKLQEEE